MLYDFMEEASIVAYKYSYKMVMSLLSVYGVYALFLGAGMVVIGAIFLIEGRFRDVDVFIDFIKVILSQAAVPLFFVYYLPRLDDWWLMGR